MHPDCAAARLKLWAKVDDDARIAMRQVRDVDDFVVWGMTEGTKHLKYRWGEKDAWINAVPSYVRLKRIEYAQNRMTMETEKLIGALNKSEKTFSGRDPVRASDSEGLLWTREAVKFLRENFPEGVSACLLGVIDLLDLAKLCYGGDVLTAKHEMQSARKALRKWYFND